MGLFDKLFGRPDTRSSTSLTGAGKNTDYGPTSLPPTPEAKLMRELMSAEDRLNFDGLLSRAFHQSPDVSFHPEMRAAFWGIALNKLADHYIEMDQTETALFYVNAAWTVSKYPVFANNAAILAIAAGDIARAKVFLLEFLRDYHNTFQQAAFGPITPSSFTVNDLDGLVAGARRRLAAIEEGINPMLV